MDIILQEIAYLMVKTYDETKNKHDACHKIEEAYPDINKDIIHGMWAAIDAYIDINV